MRRTPLSLTLALSLVSAALVLAPAPEAAAVEMVQSIQVLAWSDSGAAALAFEHVAYENGGHEMIYRLLDGKGRHKKVVVSSIQDPGAKKPQKISEKKCARAMKSFVKTLKKAGLGHVTGAPDCTTRDGRMLEVAAAHAPVLDGSWMGGDGKRLEGGGLVLEHTGTTLALGPAGAAPAKTFEHHHQYLKLTASLAPAGAMLVVLNHWRDANSALAGIYYTKSGKPEDFKAVKYKR